MVYLNPEESHVTKTANVYCHVKQESTMGENTESVWTAVNGPLGMKAIETLTRMSNPDLVP